MDKIRLGRTDLQVTRSSFGALPIQRISTDDAVRLLRKAYDSGINYFDTARAYSDSETKLGIALSNVRDKIVISSKSHATDPATLISYVDESLKQLKTDYIDILQFHNPKKVYLPGEEDEMYDTLRKIQRQGKVRFIGFTNHSLDRAIKAAESGFYDTIQFPLNHLSSEKDLELVKLCKREDLGFIAMKGMSGGLITDARISFAFLRQYENVVPIWGIQKEWELDQFVELEANPPIFEEMKEAIEKDRAELAGDFCRSCGYCLPCPADIDIPQVARMSLLLGRAPWKQYMTDEWKNKMEQVTQCIHCNHCKDHCPYELDTPELIKKNLTFYRKFYSDHIAECENKD